MVRRIDKYYNVWYDRYTHGYPDYNGRVQIPPVVDDSAYETRYNTRQIKCVTVSTEHKEIVYKGTRRYAGYAEFTGYGDDVIPIAIIIGEEAKRVVKEPCWDFIADERTKDQQEWINNHFTEIQRAWRDRPRRFR